MTVRRCWRHQLRLFWAAWGTLLDLSGRHYPRLAQAIHADARRCPHCRALSKTTARKGR